MIFIGMNGISGMTGEKEDTDQQSRLSCIFAPRVSLQLILLAF